MLRAEWYVSYCPLSQGSCACLQICILEGKSYADAKPEAITESFLDANTLLVDAKGKGVLAPGRGCEKGTDMKVVSRFHQGKVRIQHRLPRLTIELWLSMRNAVTWKHCRNWASSLATGI